MASLTSKAQDPATVTDNRPQAKWQELKQFAMLYEFRHLFVGAQQVDKVRNVAQKVLLGQSPQCTTLHPSVTPLCLLSTAPPHLLHLKIATSETAESQSTFDRRLGPSSQAKGTPSFHRQQRQS